MIQQEPKDNSGHLIGMVCVCVCVHWGEGGIQQEPKDSSDHLIGMVCVCVCSLGGGGDSARAKGQ